MARNAGVSPDTVARLERGEDLKLATVNIMRAAFEDAGVIFIEEERGQGVGVRLAKASDPKKPDDGE
ncbi:transcriptional regulator [Rhizobium sp. SL86]|uniref:transcriptional regulator n=1 Tax=Rhizobium sp. SL86 TaxID=2995148 RepID=UPI002DD446BE|nr:transcriptional regulator [Rhizobium sp. SL86]